MRLNVGIIGLGEVAQLVHLPILSDLNDKYRIKAVADISPSLNEFIVNKYNISDSYLSPTGIIQDPEIDAVFVLSPDQHHFEFVQEAGSAFDAPPAKTQRGVRPRGISPRCCLD